MLLVIISNSLLGYLDGLGDAVEQGLVKAVGVSNYSGTLFSLFFFFHLKVKDM